MAASAAGAGCSRCVQQQLQLSGVPAFRLHVRLVRDALPSTYSSEPACWTVGSGHAAAQRTARQRQQASWQHAWRVGVCNLPPLRRETSMAASDLMAPSSLELLDAGGFRPKSRRVGDTIGDSFGTQRSSKWRTASRKY
jgi:hypothetical protein